jgi:TRAP-type mannitol/chloroaromatic compound transport system permease small subunit
MFPDDGFGGIMIGLVDRGVGGLIGALKWLALAVALLLFVQWPFREWLQVWSREANDLGQCLFALFVAASVTAATRANRHIAADGLARSFSPEARRALATIGILIGLLPWTLFVGWTGWSTVTRSVGVLERFQDTGNPGYFLVKVALLLLLGLIVLQAIIDLVRRRKTSGHSQ